MNIEHMEQLHKDLLEAEAQGCAMIEEIPARFDMSTFIETDFINSDGKSNKSVCGTAGCIAGFAALRSGEPLKWNSDIEWIAKKHLELDDETAYQLFYARDFGTYDHDRITAGDAAKVVRKLIDTGKVDWSDYRNRIRSL